MNPIRVRDIARPLILTKANPIRPPKPISHRPDPPRRGVESVDLIRQLRRRADALFSPVEGVCEPDAAVRVDDDVVGGVEGAGVEGTNQEFGGVGG